MRQNRLVRQIINQTLKIYINYINETEQQEPRIQKP